MLILPMRSQIAAMQQRLVIPLEYHAIYSLDDGNSSSRKDTMLSLLISRPAESLLAAVDAFCGFLAAIQEAHATAARFESLAQMSDAELARRGLKREGLAQAVFTVAAQT
jgi:hypothetical protein